MPEKSSPSKSFNSGIGSSSPTKLEPSKVSNMDTIPTNKTPEPNKLPPSSTATTKVDRPATVAPTKVPEPVAPVIISKPAEPVVNEVDSSTSHVNVKAALQSYKTSNKASDDYSYDLSNKKPAGGAEKFKQFGAGAAGGNKCPCCAKTVYKAEELFALNSFWHPSCFTCGGVGDAGCKRRLTKQDFQVNSGSPYCNACFDRIVKETMGKGTLQSASSASPRQEETMPVTVPAPVAAAAPVVTVESPKSDIEAVPKGVLAQRAAAFQATTKPLVAPESTPSGKGSAAAEKFKQFGAGAGGNKCPCCAKTVYKAEELFALNSFWHPSCFTCGGVGDAGCRRRLTKQDFQVNSGSPYCNACFDRIVKETMGKGTLQSVSVSSKGGNGSDTNRSRSASAEVPVEPVASTPAPAQAPIITATPSSDNLSEIEASVPKGVLAQRAAAFQAASKQSSGSETSTPASRCGAGRADKFKQFGASAGGNKCPCCAKTVYKAEELFALNSFWHPSCFTCGGVGDAGCKRRLTKQDFQVNTGSPYCNACFERIVKDTISKGSLQAPSGSGINSVSPRVVAESTTTLTKPFPTKAVEPDISPRQLSPRGSGMPKCQICNTNVYKMEEVLVGDSIWHKHCFQCGAGATGPNKGCERLLNVEHYVNNDGIPYCASCAASSPTPTATVIATAKEVITEAPHKPAEEIEVIEKEEILDTTPIYIALEPITAPVPALLDELEDHSIALPSETDHEPEVHPFDDVDVDFEIVGTLTETAEAAEPENSTENKGEISAEDEEGKVGFTDVEFHDSVYRGYHLSYKHNFDDNGVLYWIATRGHTTLYENPHTTGLVVASMSSIYKGKVDAVVGRSIEPAPVYTENALNSWIKVDLGPDRLLLADNYTILHGASNKGNALRNWVLQAKAFDDGLEDNWITLKEHADDDLLSDEPNSSATWALDIPEEISDSSTIGFRYYRIVQDGPNSNGNNCLFCCGLEFYGVLFEKLTD